MNGKHAQNSREVSGGSIRWRGLSAAGLDDHVRPSTERYPSAEKIEASMPAIEERDFIEEVHERVGARRDARLEGVGAAFRGLRGPGVDSEAVEAFDVRRERREVKPTPAKKISKVGVDPRAMLSKNECYSIRMADRAAHNHVFCRHRYGGIDVQALSRVESWV